MTRFKIFASLVVALALGIAMPARAGDVWGTVSVLMVRSSDGLQYVIINGTRSSPPSCATHDYFMIADEHSDAGKAQFAILLSAYMSGKSVHVAGAGTCTRWPDGEDILAVTLGN